MNNNICKFPDKLISDTLYTSSFILETDEKIMKTPYVAEDNRLFLISQGEGEFSIDSENLCFKAGDLVFVFNGERVFTSRVNACEYMYIDFGGAKVQELFRRFDIIKGNRNFSGFDGLIPFWRESLLRASSENIDLSAQSILLYSFSRLSLPETKTNPLVGRIIKCSEENFRDSSFNISAVSEELGYNSKYISHIFKKKTGVAYSEYLRDMRIKYAISLFEHGLDSVKNVAALSGFSDPLYFSTVFKKCVGVTPKEYNK